MTKSVIDVLTEARALVAKGWCQGGYARDDRDMPCAYISERACRFCAEGAMFRALWDQGASDAFRFLQVERLTQFNDAPGRTQFEVVQMFDAAIERAKETARA